MYLLPETAGGKRFPIARIWISKKLGTLYEALGVKKWSRRSCNIGREEVEYTTVLIGCATFLKIRTEPRRRLYEKLVFL